jgi:hypothetical protein
MRISQAKGAPVVVIVVVVDVVVTETVVDVLVLVGVGVGDGWMSEEENTIEDDDGVGADDRDGAGVELLAGGKQNIAFKESGWTLAANWSILN